MITLPELYEIYAPIAECVSKNGVVMDFEGIRLEALDTYQPGDVVITDCFMHIGNGFYKKY